MLFVSFFFFFLPRKHNLIRLKSTGFFFPLAGINSIGTKVYSAIGPSVCEEWQLLVDQMDQSHQRAVVIKNKHSGSFLAVRGGRFVGASSYNEDCKWILV